MPMNPTVTETLTRIPAATTAVAVSTRDCTSENEPSGLPEIRKAATSPLRALFREL